MSSSGDQGTSSRLEAVSDDHVFNELVVDLGLINQSFKHGRKKDLRSSVLESTLSSLGKRSSVGSHDNDIVWAVSSNRSENCSRLGTAEAFVDT